MTREILCFGDSNKTGNKSLPFLFLRSSSSKTVVLPQSPSSTMRQSCSFNFCCNIPVLLESHAPIDQVVLMLGTNDCKSYYHASAEVIGLGVEKLIGQIRQAGEHIKILLVSPILLGEKVWEPEYDPEFDEQSVETSRQLKTVYSRIAKKHGIDFLAASDVAEPSSRDREHMDEESHRRFAEAVYERLAG